MDKEIILINTQFAVVFNNPLSKPDDLYSDLNKKMGSVFDDTPITLPIPNEIQFMDIPVVQMRSKSGVFSLNIARNRADFIFAGSGEEDFSDKKDAFINYSKIIFDHFLSSSAIKRIAFVTRFFVAEENPNEAIGKILNDDFKLLHNREEATDSKPIDSFVRYATQSTLENFEVNNLTSLEYFIARITGKEDNLKGVLITRDFNTNAEKNYSSELTASYVEAFIKENSEIFKLDVIENLIWPTQE